jgi:hypothetical protein
VLAALAWAGLFSDGPIQTVPHAAAGQRCISSDREYRCGGRRLDLVQPRAQSVAMLLHSWMARCSRPLPCRYTAVCRPQHDTDLQAGELGEVAPVL